MKQPELGQFIAGLRKQKGFSQEELSTGCKMNLRSIQRIEAGKVKPRLSTLKALSSVLEYDFLKTKPDLSKPRLSIREKNFLKNYIKSVPDNKLSPTFIWLYSSIIMMAGIIFLTYTFLFTLNNLQNNKVVYYVFLPGLFGSLILFLLGAWIFKHLRKQQDRQKLAGYIKKHILSKK